MLQDPYLSQPYLLLSCYDAATPAALHHQITLKMQPVTSFCYCTHNNIDMSHRDIDIHHCSTEGRAFVFLFAYLCVSSIGKTKERDRCAMLWLMILLFRRKLVQGRTLIFTVPWSTLFFCSYGGTNVT